MRLIYVLDYCFQQTPDGAVWTDTSYDSSFWDPYLDMYEEVLIISRAKPVERADRNWLRVDSSRIRVHVLAPYQRPTEYFLKRSLIEKQIDAAFAMPGVVVLRVPSNLARCAAGRLRRMDRPYSVDVVGDPWRSLAPGVSRVRGRAFFRLLFTLAQRRICREASGVSYVAQSLSAFYPAGRGRRVLVCSDARLDDSWLALEPRDYRAPARHLITVATLTQIYKGIDVLLRSMAICREKGVAFTLTIVGTGRYRSYLEDLSRDLGLSDAVTFTGALPWGPALAEALDRADIFVLPSLVEVMPRALLEAMARALPAIATRVGAVSEVLGRSDTVDAGNAEKLAEKLICVANQPQRLTKMSSRNLARARQFDSRVLLPQWLDYHRDLCRVEMPAARRQQLPSVVPTFSRVD
jgi:glycosyltransferase involved in cell wall biosynthesis